MRALVTGASGFVGRYLVDALRREGAEILACGGPHDPVEEYFPLDLADEQTIRAALEVIAPTVVFHLAAQTFVPESLASPIETYQTNTIGTARLAAAIRDVMPEGSRPRLVFVSSAEVYGARTRDEMPLTETLDVRPANPYAASKAAAEAVLTAECHSFGLDVVVARAFNHIGPGQGRRFVVPSFAAQLARIAHGDAQPLLVGNIDAARDFLDVRDVVDAYVALARDGRSGETYNVCSGGAVAIRSILQQLIALARVPVEVREDPARMRPADVPLLVGNPTKLARCAAWKPKVPLAQSLRDIYEDALADSAAAGNTSGTA